MKKFLLLCSSTLLFSQTINIEKASVRTSYENLKLSNTENMGLASFNYLLEPNNYFYYGLGTYGAVSGDRGGFFVGGFTAGVKYQLYKSLYLDSGAYVGGGGGASAGQGGGLMLKAYAGALYRFDDYSLGLNYSYVTFPNGDIDSKQLAFVADARFNTIFADEHPNPKELHQYNFTNNQDYMVGTYQTYFTKDGTFTRSGAPLTQNISLVGFEYGVNTSKHTLAYFETAGAMKGATGYMEILGGLGYKQELGSHFNAIAKLSLGAAGGGQVDTGGGGVTKASLNLNYNPVKSINTGLEAGYYHAFNDGYNAQFMKLSLGVNADFLSLSKTKSDIDYNNISSQKFNLRVANQRYLYSDTLSTNPNNKSAVDMFGMKIDWFATNKLYISGQAFGAYKGGAGGYAVGMFALGYVQPLLFDVSAIAEVGVGAGGGGSINSGAGLIIQPMVGLMYDFTQNISAELMVGKVSAVDGALDTNVVDFSLVYKFNKLVLK